MKSAATNAMDTGVVFPQSGVSQSGSPSLGSQQSAPEFSVPQFSALWGATSQQSATLDPATLQVLLSRLTGVAEEMGVVLCRAAFSPNIKERADCSSALFSSDGELLAQAEHIPVHLGAMPASVKAVIDHFGDTCAPGDQFIVNDPFAGGTHLNDITVVAPCFAGSAKITGQASSGRAKQGVLDEFLLGWVANRAHHADLGGAAPGSMPADATEIFQEGLRIPPLRLTEEVKAMIATNSRTPGERLGDLEAQIGANTRGIARLAELSQKLPSLQSAALDFDTLDFEEVLAYGERRMRDALAELPSGEWSFSDQIDSHGPSSSQQVPSKINLKVSVGGGEIIFDFTGTDPAVSGNTNAVKAVTESCVAFALRTATDPSIPANGGAMRPVKVLTSPGSIVDALPPVAVGAGNVEVSQRVADVCLGALAQIVPSKVGAASAGTMNNVLIGGQGWVYYETVASGQGARPTKDGMSGIQTNMTNTKNTPVEALERSYPVRVRRLRLRHGSGGKGIYKGGDGIVRDLEMLEAVTVSLITERRHSNPWGMNGGSPGAKGENWLLPGGDEGKAELLEDKVTLELQPGDVLRMLTPGGGGWGGA